MKEKANKKQTLQKAALWLLLIVLVLGGGTAIYAKWHGGFDQQIGKKAQPKEMALKKTKTLTDSQIWGYPFSKCYMKKIKYKSGQKFGKTDVVRRVYPSKSYFHDGWDFGWSEVGKKAPVLAVHSGTVKKIAYCSGLEYFVWIVSDDGYVEIYQEGFLNPDDIVVKKGQKVKVGQKIGNMTGSHLHLGVTKTDKDYITKKEKLPFKNYWKDNDTWLNPMELITKSLKLQEETKQYNEEVKQYNQSASAYNAKLASKAAKEAKKQ